MSDDRSAELKAAARAEAGDRQLRAVLADLFEHTETLVRQEVELGKAEIHVRVDKAKAALVHGAISAGLYYAAYLTTLATLVLALSEWLPGWAAALVIAVAASAGAVVFTMLGKKALDEVKQPPQTESSHAYSRPQLRQRAQS